MSEDKKLQENIGKEELLETTETSAGSEEKFVDSEEKIEEVKIEKPKVSPTSKEETDDKEVATKATSEEVTTPENRISEEKKENVLEENDESTAENAQEKKEEVKIEEPKVSSTSEEETDDKEVATKASSEVAAPPENKISEEEKENVLEEIDENDSENAEEKIKEVKIEEPKVSSTSEEETDDKEVATTTTSEVAAPPENKTSKAKKEKEDVLDEIDENNAENAQEKKEEVKIEEPKVSSTSEEETDDKEVATKATSEEVSTPENKISEEKKENVLEENDESTAENAQEKKEEVKIEEPKVSSTSEEEADNKEIATTAMSKEVTTPENKISEDEKENVLEEIDENDSENAEEKIKEVKIEEPKVSSTSEEETDDKEVATTTTSEIAAPPENKTSKAKKEKEDVLDEIDENNAEDAEDTDNHHRHNIPILDYHSMSMENLVGELQRLVRNEKVQAIKKHVDGIKSEFDLKFQEFIEHKKEDFVSSGGNEIDFRYNSVTKRQFNEVYSDYREKRNQYYKNLEKDLKANLNKRLEIIERLKGLVNVDEDMNTTYKAFKDLQEEWRNAGPVPRTNYNDVWRTYQHHIEIFYDFLHLNRELRDLDFKHNLAEKEKLAQQAEILATEPDLNKVFRELQTLHKIWKEDIGPVGQEHREAIWERFSNATKVLHQRRQEHYKQLDAEYEENLVKKNEIIASISALANNIAKNHRGLQQQIKELEELRNNFFNAGKVPRKQNEKTWAAFKNEVRNFNRNKNAYYKNLKKDQQENLDKKRELLNLAISLKESEDWDTTTSEMKRIQSEWKKIGHVPRRYSDKIWKDFKNACNHYFDRLHTIKNKGLKEEEENFEKKNACLEKLKVWQLTENREADIKTVKTFIEEWKSYGRVPFKKKNIDQKFHKVLDALFKKLDISRQESELLKYGNKIKQLADSDNERAIQNERSFIRKKIEESNNEIRQLENNLQFFSNASEDNPLVQDVIKRVNTHKESLATWKAKLKKLNIMKNSLNKATEEEAENDLSAGSEEKEI